MKLSDDIVDRICLGLITVEELKALPAEEVRAVKSDSDRVHQRFMSKRAPRSLDAEARTVEHEASNDLMDRMGDRIEVRGWDVSAFKENPILAWMHNMELPPLGLVRKLTKASEEDRNVLLSTSRFHPQEKNPFAELIYKMVSEGDLPGSSVGFRPLETIRPSSEEELEKLGVGPYGVYFKRQELLELSIVTVPANPKTLTRKLDQYAKDGAFSWAVINDAQRELGLEGEAKQESRARARAFVDMGRGLVVEDQISSEFARAFASVSALSQSDSYIVDRGLALELAKAVSIAVRAELRETVLEINKNSGVPAATGTRAAEAAAPVEAATPPEEKADLYDLVLSQAERVWPNP